MDLSNTALVTHGGCMDGSTCAIVFLVAGGKRENIFFVGPGKVDDTIVELKDSWSGPIIMADISFSLELAKTIVRSDVYLFDHHKTALPLVEIPWCSIEVNNERCGSKMLYEWLLTNADDDKRAALRYYQSLVDAVDDNDRWVQKNPHSGIMSVFHNLLGQSMFIDRFIRESSIELDPQEDYSVSLATRKKEEYIERKKKEVQIQTKQIQGDTVRVGYVLADNWQSALGNAICSDVDMDVDISVMIGLKKVSMRSQKGGTIDVAAIAKANKGGGHHSAAGFGLYGIFEKSLIDIVQEKMRLE
jgi:oligoribonuclease NrnB/cAMP/cGMP phosphodiesterase (DHH superfamily)